LPPSPRSPLFPYTTLFRSADGVLHAHAAFEHVLGVLDLAAARALEVALEQRLQLDDEGELLAFREPLAHEVPAHAHPLPDRRSQDRKSTRLNSSHVSISYA